MRILAMSSLWPSVSIWLHGSLDRTCNGPYAVCTVLKTAMLCQELSYFCGAVYVELLSAVLLFLLLVNMERSKFVVELRSWRSITPFSLL